MDRFKFRIYFKGNKYAEAGYQNLTRKDVVFALRTDGQMIRNVVYECQAEGHEGSPCNMPFTPNNDLYDIQFCTGLKDANGRLIYEGDILKETYFDGNEVKIDITTVEWDKDCASFVMKHSENDYTYFNDYGVDLDDFEIIGNICENKKGDKDDWWI